MGDYIVQPFVRFVEVDLRSKACQLDTCRPVIQFPHVPVPKAMETIKNPAARGGRESAGPEQRRGTFDDTRIGDDVHTFSAKNPPDLHPWGDRCRNLACPYNHGI